ncbi:DUF2156 domain-containing protein [bacterium]|nr:DUF2156 domain-containing protein [bacterium]
MKRGLIVVLEFKAIDKDSIINNILPYIKQWKHLSSIYTPCVLYMWSDFIGGEYCVADDIFYFKQKMGNGTTIFGMPLGGALDTGIQKVIEDAQNTGIEPLFFVPESVVREMTLFFDLTAEKQEDDFDYIYLPDDLVNLRGKKFHAKRNYIARFIRENPSYEYKALTKDQVAAVKNFLKESVEIKKDCSEFTSSDNYEKCRAAKVLDNFEVLGLSGGVLYVEKKVIGFTIGAKIGNVLYVHIEKGSREYIGSYEFLNNAYASANAEGVTYINREDDANNMGLRKAKESYNPVIRLYNYKVKINKPNIL